MRTILVNSGQQENTLVVGRRGENEATEVVFEFTEWISEFGNGVITLLVKRPEETNPYPVVLSVANDKATWTVSSTDTAYEGIGLAEFVYTVGTKIVKSIVFKMNVLPDIGVPSETPPDPYETWVDTLVDLGTDAEADALKSEGFAVGQQNGVDVGNESPYFQNNAKYYSEVNAGLEGRFNGEITLGSPAITEWTPDGTWLKNQLWLNKSIATVGYAYEADTNKVWIYELFGSNTPDGGSQVSYRLVSKDGETEYELTVENAPISSQISNCPAFAKYRTSISGLADHADYRLCRIRYDSNGNEIERMYSAQYRYTISNGEVTRRKFNTASTNRSHIIDIGLLANESDAASTFNTINTNTRTILPLVSTLQGVQWKFIIPDSMFDNAPYGLSVVAVDGESKNKYVGSVFFKAEKNTNIFWADEHTIPEIGTALETGQLPVYRYNFTQDGTTFKGVALYSYTLTEGTHTEYYFFDYDGNYKIEVLRGYDSSNPNNTFVLTVAINTIDSTLTQTGKAADAKVVGDSIDVLTERFEEQISNFNGEIFVGSPALTERVPEGTLIKNQLWANKTAAILGYAFDTEENLFYLYGIFGSNTPAGGSQKSYRLLEKDSENEPYELTLENAPTVTEFSGANATYKFRVRFAQIPTRLDYRLCRVRYDSSGNEVERIYSAQYRYFFNNGVVTRTRVNTAPTDPSHIIDIGLHKASNSNNMTFNAIDTSRKTIYPLVSTVQEIQYQFIVPDAMFDDAPYGYSLEAVGGDGRMYLSSNFGKAESPIDDTLTVEGKAADAKATGDAIAELDQRFTGYTFVGTPALTERVSEGTWLKNQIWSGKVVSLVGCAYDADIGKLYIYAIFGTYVPPGGTCRTYRMVLRDSADPQREFTIDDTSITTEIPAGSGGNVENYKYNMTSSSTQDHIDIRLCRVIYDSDGNEVDRIYSAQYRYTIANGKVTQTRFATTPTDGSHIVDIGLRKNGSSVRTTINFTDDQVQSLLPLVSTPQGTQWKFIIPDSMFDGASNGLSVIVATGDGKQYVAPSFYKAESDVFIVTLTPTEQDFSGTMDKTVAEITEAYQANKRIFFRVMYSGSEHEDVVCSGIVVADGYYPSFRGYIINSNMLIMAYTPTGLTDGTSNGYATLIYTLTPLT